MAEPVKIACCPVHGLHGDRHFCYVCGGPVERVSLVPLAELERLRGVITAYVVAIGRAPGNRDEAEIEATSRALIAEAVER